MQPHAHELKSIADGPSFFQNKDVSSKVNEMSFHVIKPGDEDNAHLLASMHHLRWKVFVKGLKWKHGLQVINCMEHDQYDDDSANYVVHVDKRKQVDACIRFYPTTGSYMIKDHYRDFVSDECPSDSRIEELTRFGALLDTNAPNAGVMATAAIEYGLSKGVTHYIGISNIGVKKVFKRIDWDHQTLGPTKKTPDGNSSVVSLLPVNEEVLHRMRRKHQVTGSLFGGLNPCSA